MSWRTGWVESVGGLRVGSWVREMLSRTNRRKNVKIGVEGGSRIPPLVVIGDFVVVSGGGMA